MAVSGFAELTLQSTDLDALEQFYTQVIGLEVLAHESDRVWLATGPRARLGLWSPGEKEFDDQGGVHVHFALTCEPETLDAIAQRLREAGTETRGPVDHDGGDRSLYWTDPAGNRGEAWELFATGGNVADVSDDEPSTAAGRDGVDAGEDAADGDGDAAEDLAKNVSNTGRRDYAPKGHPPETGRWATAKRAFREFQANALTDQAAALTYYGLLAVFPGLIALVSILGLFGDPVTTTRELTGIIRELAPGSAAETFSGPIEAITANESAAGVMFVVGVAAALWSASGYVGAFIRASNVIYETPEGRPIWKLRPLQVAITFITVVLLVALLLGLVLTGPVVDAVAGPLGIGDQAVSVWNVAKWPVMAFVALVILAILYYASPNVRLPKFSLVTPGALLALFVWLVASVAFAVYVANFGSYNKTYGTLGGVISLLVWMWLSNVAVLLGVQLNAELERNRELDAGIEDATRELQLDARDEPDHPATT